MKWILLVGNKVREILIEPDHPRHDQVIAQLRELNITARREVAVDFETTDREFDKLVKAITLREKPIEPHIPQIGIGRRRGKGERKKNRADRWR